MKKTQFIRISTSIATILALMITSFFLIVASANAATLENINGFRNELIEMLNTGDETVHDVSAYGLVNGDFWPMWTDLTLGECSLAFGTNYYPNYKKIRNSSGIIISLQLIDTNPTFDEDIITVYEKVLDILDGIDDKMTDLDKVLYLNEEIKDLAVYTSSYNYDHEYAFDIVHALNGVFVHGKAVCQGYTDAYSALLSMVGIENARVCSVPMNHTWSFVKIDGKWYHSDVTWNDCSWRNVPGNNDSRTYLMRNDDEFLSGLPVNHYNLGSYRSDSTDFTDWFVHDITTEMCYYDGLWYYVEPNTNTLVSSDVYGNNVTVLYEALDTTFELVDMDNDTVIYKVDGQTYEHTVTELMTMSASDYISVADVAWNDFASWRAGHYSWTTGIYENYTSRLCLNNYVTADPSTSFTARLSDPEYRLLVREMSSEMEFICTQILQDGESFTSSADTVYLGISCCKINNNSYIDYESLFADGFAISLNADVSDVDWSDFASWRAGHYSWTTGIYENYTSRLCLNNYVTADPSTSFTARLSDPEYRLLVREMSSEMEFICTQILQDGESFTSSADTVYLGISCCKTNNNSYIDYESLFADGFAMSLNE